MKLPVWDFVMVRSGPVLVPPVLELRALGVPVEKSAALSPVSVAPAPLRMADKLADGAVAGPLPS
jgi:hypothetical protein